MSNIETEVVVIGAGPGGYTAAFRAADLGKKVTLVERFDNLGGVCLNVGCIPSKALLHVAKVLDDAHDMGSHGVSFGEPQIDLEGVRGYKSKVVGRLTMGLKGLAKQRKVQVVNGEAEFKDKNNLTVKTKDGEINIKFENAIIAVGSSPIKLPFIPDDERVFDSTGALELKDIPEKFLVIGGGIIGMEMATVYAALKSKVTVVEFMDNIIPGVDKDIVKPLLTRMKKKLDNILLETKVTNIEPKDDGLWVTFEGKNAPAEPQRFDKILYSIGRSPNGKLIKAENAGVNVDKRGFISTDNQMKTNVSNIFAIGDVVGNPMLAHKAIPEGRVAAEVIAGKKHFFEPVCIPSVAYTDPEIAWVGMTETEAKKNGIDYGVGSFPWMASGKALAMNRDEGITKVIFDKKTHKLIGACIVGVHAGDLISEAALAIEMGCDAEDISLTIHPHPTVAETIAVATEMFEGTATDLYAPKK